LLLAILPLLLLLVLLLLLLVVVLKCLELQHLMQATRATLRVENKASLS
jgi:hypothetical protein